MWRDCDGSRMMGFDNQEQEEVFIYVETRTHHEESAKLNASGQTRDSSNQAAGASLTPHKVVV